jgi:glucosamine--fructose-6-phosphate aminotransferase (isomerizing)
MSREADLSVVLTCCQEKSVCTTNSVTGMILALQWMAATNDKNFRAELEDLPELGEKLIAPSIALGEMLGNDDRINKYAFIGSGPFYGIARECQLKIKEMTLLPSDSYPLMDYRHGPNSNVDMHMLITMLCSDSGRQWERECADELMRYGGQLLVISNSPVLGKHTSELYLHCDLSEYARGPLYLPIVQSMAATKALRLGMDPDNPRNLSYWVKTKALQ